MTRTTKTAHEFTAAITYDIMIIEDGSTTRPALDIYARKREGEAATPYLFMFGIPKETGSEDEIQEAYKLAVANLPDYMEMFEDGEG